MNETAPASAAERFERLYQEHPPWEIDSPQPAIIELFKSGQITGRVLDAGCGTGHNAIWLARQGLDVVAFDFIVQPITIARQRAASEQVHVDWRILDALKLETLDERFDTIIDSGLFHVFPDDIRTTYVAGLKNVLAPGGRVHIICFSDKQPGSDGPLRMSEHMLRKDFSAPWHIEGLTETRYSCLLQSDGPQHDGQGAHAWCLTATIN